MSGLQAAMHLLLFHVHEDALLINLQLTYTINSISFTHQDQEFKCSKANIV